MTKHACTCAISAPSIDLDAHRRIRLRRLGLQDATARLIAEHAFGPARDSVLVVAVADVGTLAVEASR